MQQNSAVLTIVALLSGGFALATEPPANPVAAAFRQLDSNHDEQLSLTEYQTRAGDPRVLVRDFHLFDLDGSQTLTSSEFAAIPGLVPPFQRGALPDPFDDLLERAVEAMDAAYEGWDQRPNHSIPSHAFAINFTGSLSPTGRRTFSQEMVQQVDPDGNQQTTRAEARRFLEIQLGIRAPTGELLREPGGRVAVLSRFAWVDANQDHRLDREEFLARWGGQDLQEIFDRGDKNHDASISMLEFLAPDWNGYEDPVEWFRKADADFDGLLTSGEVRNATWEARQVLVPMMFAAFDDDSDGKLSLTEYRLCMLANRTAAWESIPLDEDRDGKLSFEEFKFDRCSCNLLRRLYFHRFDRDQDGQLTHDEYAFKLKSPNALQFLSADRRELRQIYVNPEYPNNGSPAVSPDGQKILFDTWRGGESFGESRIFLMNIDGSHVSNLCHGLMPTWSADGKQFTCSRYETGNNGVWIMNLDGTEAHRIGDGWGSQWSPDGKTIAYTRNGGIAAFDVESKEIRDVLLRSQHPFQSIYHNPTWSPDSSRLAFKGTQQDQSAIASISMRDGGPDLKVHFETNLSFDPDSAWTPDGQWLIFSMHSPELKRSRLYELNMTKNAPVLPVEGLNEKLTFTAPTFIPGGTGMIVGTRE